MSLKPEDEEWRPIPGAEVYEASSLGRIRRRGRPVRLRMDRQGYLRVNLHIKNKRHGSPQVSRAVCSAFHGPPPEGTEAAHLNGRRSDNRPENLGWVTKKENEGHKVAHGTLLKGSAVGNAVLSEDRVLEARSRAAAGESSGSIARAWGVSRATLANAIRGTKWRHLTGAVKGRTQVRPTKLSDAQVDEMRAMKKAGRRSADLATLFGIHKVSVDRICRGASRGIVATQQQSYGRPAKSRMRNMETKSPTNSSP